MSKPKHILVIRFSAMGDVAMTVPVLRAFTQQYPEVKITVLTREFFKPFFRDLPNVEVFEADLKKKHKGVFGLFKLSKQLKKFKIDAVADLHNVLRTKILKLFFIGWVFQQVDKGRTEKKALIKGELFRQLKTTHQRYADVFYGLGYEIDLFGLQESKIQKLNNEILEVLGNDDGKRIGIAPFAQYESKMYPLDFLEEVIKTMSKKHKILLFGGGEREMKLLEVLQEKYENVINLAGKFSIDEELNIISNLDVMLSMDSGNGHLAAMLGIKVITIWNVTHPYAGFAPFNQPEKHQILSDRKRFPLIPTSIYGNRYPEGYEEASRTISPDEVIARIEMIL